MVSSANVKRFLAPLRERHPEFIYRDNMIYYRVGGHLAWACRLGDIIMPRGCLRPTPMIRSLFTGERTDGIGEGLLMLLYRRDRSNGVFYRWTDPESQIEFADVFDREVIPALNSIRTLEDYARLVDFPRCALNLPGKLPQWYGPRVHWWYPLGIALGQLDWARETAALVEKSDLRDKLEDFPWNAEERAYLRRVMEFVPLVRADDRAGMIALLHELLRDDVRRFELEPYWKPEPFPIEMMS